MNRGTVSCRSLARRVACVLVVAVFPLVASPSECTSVSPGVLAADPSVLPDLVVTRAYLSMRLNGNCIPQIEPLYLYVCVLNQGAAAAGPFTVAVGGVDWAHVDLLPARSERCVEGEWLFPTDAVVVDAHDTVAESNEDNNRYAGAVAIPTAPVTCSPTATASPTPTPTPSPTGSPCSLLFDGQVTDAATGTPISGGSVCLQPSPCTHPDDAGRYAGLCYGGQSSAGSRLCARAPGYREMCLGPWTPDGSRLEVDFSLSVATPTPPSGSCAGDCDDSGEVTIDEILIGVDLAQDPLGIDACGALDVDSNGAVTVDELMLAVQAAMWGCEPLAVPRQRIEVHVRTDDGAPVDSFTLHVDQRGPRRTRSAEIEVVSGNVARYTVLNRPTTVVFTVNKAGYETGIAVLNSEELSNGDGITPVTVLLHPEGHCVPVAGQCCGAVAPGVYVVGDVIVGLDDWLSSADVEVILDRYCLESRPTGTPGHFAMWIELIGAEVQPVIDTLRSSGMVLFAEVRGSPVTIIVSFNLSATLDAASDLIDGIEGVKWLRTIPQPVSAVTIVPPGTEGEWICTFDRDVDIEYAQPNYIISIPVL